METEFEMKKPCCNVVDIDGQIANGKQFDLDITLPEDRRNVIFGVIKNCFKEPVEDAVVKLIEIDKKDYREERKPVSHTFTDKHGEFVFGPLCPDKEYAIEIWVDDVKHVKVCAKINHERKCLKGVKKDCDCFIKKDEHKECDCKKDDYKEYDCKKDEYKECNYKKDDCKKDEHKECDYKKDDCKKDEHKECNCQKCCCKKCEEHKCY